jgi:glycosyltransferase involved in cell wall biosynthesis
MVFCEAAAYGLPVVATRTGGVPEIVTEGENGVTLPLEARGDAYARVIARIHADEACYRHMAACGRRAFETRLNWEVWGDTAARLISGAIGRAAARPIPDENIAAGAGGTAPRRYR